MQTKRQARRAARHLYRLCLVNGALDETRVRLVGRRLAQSRRRAAVAVLGGFQRLVRLELDRQTARVESATPLAGPQRDAIAKRLADRYGPRLNIVFGDDPGLIGGMRIKVASHVYDETVRARLNALATRF